MVAQMPFRDEDKLFVFDLDGTLADINHRLKWIHDGYKNWNKFLESCDEDSPNQWVIDLFDMCRQVGTVIVLSGRNDVVKKKTIAWLIEHNIMYDYLLMRKEKDYRPDEIIKKEMLKNFLRDQNYKVQFIVDDRQRVVDMWRANGYNVLQCNAWKEK